MKINLTKIQIICVRENYSWKFEDQGLCLITKYINLLSFQSQNIYVWPVWQKTKTIQISLIYAFIWRQWKNWAICFTFRAFEMHRKSNIIRNSKFGIYNNFSTIRTSFTIPVCFFALFFSFVKINLIGLKNHDE